MVKLEKLIAPGETVIYRARFGGQRLFLDLVLIALGLASGALLGPGVIVVMLVLASMIYRERKQIILVTNQRVLHVHSRWSGLKIDEINLRQVESIRDNGQRITIVGSGGTKLVLPPFLADLRGLGHAIRSGGASVAQAPVQAALALYQPMFTEDGPRPFWKRPVPLTILIILGLMIIGNLFAPPKPDETSSAQVQTQTAVTTGGDAIGESERR